MKCNVEWMKRALEITHRASYAINMGNIKYDHHIHITSKLICDKDKQ